MNGAKSWLLSRPRLQIGFPAALPAALANCLLGLY
jgi:hypothetical protein